MGAECTGLSPWPSFTETASSARRIVIGTVTETLGGAVNNRFTLGVDEVLRGEAPDTIDFEAFRSGAPQPICPEDSVLRVHRVGERLALAYGARLPGWPERITAVAFVAPSKPDRSLLPGMETVTVAQVRRLAALPSTDTIAAMPPTEPVASLDCGAAPTAPLVDTLALVVGLAAGSFVLARPLNRRHRATA
jgi:hypothetical protein